MEYNKSIVKIQSSTNQSVNVMSQGLCVECCSIQLWGKLFEMQTNQKNGVHPKHLPDPSKMLLHFEDTKHPCVGLQVQSPPRSIGFGSRLGILRACTKINKKLPRWPAFSGYFDLAQVGENFILSLSPKQLGVCIFFLFGMGTVGGWYRRTIDKKYASRMGTQKMWWYFDLGDFFAKSVFIRRKHHQSPSRNPWDPMGTRYILHLHLAT